MVSSDREFRDELAKRVEAGVKAGELNPSVDPEGLATVIVGMLRGVALQALLDDVDLPACRTEIEQLLIGRLRQEQPRSPRARISR